MSIVLHARGPAFRGVAALRPSGEILIVTTICRLNEIAQFTTSAQPSPRGMMFVLTDDGRLGRPGAAEAKADQTPTLPSLQPGRRKPATARCGGSGIGAAGSRRPARSLSSRDRRRNWVGGIHRCSSSAPGNAFGFGMLLPEFRPDSGGPRSISGSSPHGLLALLAAAWLALRLRPLVSQPLAELAAQGQRIASLDLSETRRCTPT